MKTEILCFFVSIFLVTCLKAESDVEAVVAIDGDNFKTVIDGADTLMEFYAPWCGHCRQLAPAYREAAEMLKAENSEIVLANCDVTKDENKEWGAKYQIMSFPTMKLFRKGSIEDPEDYEGSRDAKGIVDAVKKAFGPASLLLNTKKEFEGFGKEEILVVGVFSGETSPAFQVYYKVIEKFRKELMEVGHAFNPEYVPWCNDDVDHCKKPLLGVFNSVEKNLSRYEGNFEEDLVYEWIHEKITPQLIEVDPSRNRMMKKLRELFKKPEARLIGYSLEDQEETPSFKEALIAADKSDKRVNAMYIDPKKNEKAAAFFALKNEDYPAIVIHDHSLDKKYVKKNCAPSEMMDWIAKWEAGEVQEFLKSEEVPKENDGPVKVIVAKTYKETLESGKDMLLEFYAPWCGHCKKLAPIYEDLGKHFQDNDNIIIAKMDSANNDVPDIRFQIQGYPTIKYFHKNGVVSDYIGNRTLGDLKDFVNKALSGISQTPDDLDEAETQDVEEIEIKVDEQKIEEEEDKKTEL